MSLSPQGESPAAPGRWFALQLLTCFGLGRIPIAPGTFGSLPPVVLAALLASMYGGAALVDAILVLLAVAFGIACVRFGAIGEDAFGRKDPSQVVADEVAGQAITLLLLPWRAPGEEGALAWNLGWAVAGFVLFRLFDVLKPGPIRRVQAMGGGSGILADDLLAGVFAATVLHAAAATMRTLG